MNDQTLVKPVKGEVYRLTYLGPSDARGRDIISKDFTYLAARGGRYYFHAEASGTDLLVDKYRFNTYLTNTVDMLMKA